MKIAVVGGSIAGLFAAVFLREKGFSVKIFESASDVNSLLPRAGLVLQPEFYEMLEKIKLFDPQEICIEAKMKKKWSSEGELLSCDDDLKFMTDGERLFKKLKDITPGETFLPDHALCGVDSSETQVQLKFLNGHEESFDYVIAADGRHSRVRQILFPEVLPKYSGFTAWGGILETNEFVEFQSALNLLFLKNSQFTAYFCSREKLNWSWYRNIDLSSVDSISKEQLLSEARSELPDHFFKLVEKTKTLLSRPVFDLSLPKMIQQRAIFIGDAAFMVRPQTGRSVYKACLDAYELAEALSAQALPEFLGNWEANAFARGTRLSFFSRQTTNEIQFGIPRQEPAYSASLTSK